MATLTPREPGLTPEGGQFVPPWTGQITPKHPRTSRRRLRALNRALAIDPARRRLRNHVRPHHHSGRRTRRAPSYRKPRRRGRPWSTAGPSGRSRSKAWCPPSRGLSAAWCSTTSPTSRSGTTPRTRSARGSPTCAPSSCGATSAAWCGRTRSASRCSSATSAGSTTTAPRPAGGSPSAPRTTAWARSSASSAGWSSSACSSGARPRRSSCRGSSAGSPRRC
jgi:hypothetical protein